MKEKGGSALNQSNLLRARQLKMQKVSTFNLTDNDLSLFNSFDFAAPFPHRPSFCKCCDESGIAFK
jgi:hypothetical protein